MADNIRQLEDAVGAAKVALLRAEKALKEARIAAMPFQVGDVVTDTHGNEFIVRSIEPWSTGSGWCKVSPRTKSGEWSGAIRSNGTSNFTKAAI